MRFKSKTIIVGVLASMFAGLPLSEAAQSRTPYPSVQNALRNMEGFIDDNLIRNGQDLTRPVSRFDFRYQYKNLGQDTDSHTITYRLEKTRMLSRRWTLDGRIDLPTIFNNAGGSGGTKGPWKFGMGDLLTQSIFVYSLTKSQAFGGGARFIFPTATQDQFGSGKYQFVPIGTYRVDTNWIRKGAFFNPTIRYDFDIGGQKDRSHISQLQMGPLIEVPVTHGVFVDLYSSADISYDFVKHEWFVPVNFLVGKLWGKKFITSAEFWFPMIQETRYYDFKIEARIGYFF